MKSDPSSLANLGKSISASHLPQPIKEYMISHFFLCAPNTLTNRMYIMSPSHNIQLKAAKKK